MKTLALMVLVPLFVFLAYGVGLGAACLLSPKDRAQWEPSDYRTYVGLIFWAILSLWAILALCGVVPL